MSGESVTLSVPLPLNRRLAIGRVAAVAILLALGSSLLQAGQTTPHRHEARHEIDQLEEAWRTAILNSDTATMAGLLSDDYIAVTSSGTLQTKDEVLANMRAHRVHFTTLDISDRKVRFYGSTALVNSLAEVEGTNPEGQVVGAFRYTRVYVRDSQGHWKIVSFEASRIRQAGERRRQDSGPGTK